MTTLKILTCLVLVLVSEAGVHGRAPNVLVVASSKHNHTFQLGAAIAEGAAAAGAGTRVLRVAEANFTRDVLAWCDAVVLGSPTHFGNPSADLLAWIEAEWAGSWTDPAMGDEVGAVFATGAGLAQGLEHVIAGLSRALLSFRVRVVTPDVSAWPSSGYGAVAVTGTPPWFNDSAHHYRVDDVFLAAGRALGARVAGAAAQQIAVASLPQE